MSNTRGQGERPDAGTPVNQPPRGPQGHGDDVIYRPLQAWSRPHPAEGLVSVHFATRDYPERRFTLTSAAARELAIQLMRHSKRVGRAVDSGGEHRGAGS